MPSEVFEYHEVFENQAVCSTVWASSLSFSLLNMGIRSTCLHRGWYNSMLMKSAEKKTNRQQKYFGSWDPH